VLLNATLRELVMKGYVALAPSVGEGTQLYAGYAARMRAIPATTGNGTHCNIATDDDPTNPSYLWAQDLDSNPSTPLACSGDDNQIVRHRSHSSIWPRNASHCQ
jgi:hypothetical protein